MIKAKKDELQHSIREMMHNIRCRIDINRDIISCILGILFYRYISEDLVSYINGTEVKTESSDFNYVALSDAEAGKFREKAAKSKGFFISPGDLFWNIIKTVSENNNLNATLGAVFQRIEESAQGNASEYDFAGLFDGFDLDSYSLGDTFTQRNENLIIIMNGIAALNLGNTKCPDVEAFGEASECVMSFYASDFSKSDGMFFTPDSVSELCVLLGTADKDVVNKVYDPACGSGSLLLKAKTILGNGKVRNGYFGQDINFQIYNLCRMNMILHGLKYDEFNIACGDTLIDPQHWNDEPFDLIVSNPPFSMRVTGNGYSSLIDDPRFAPVGVLPPKSGMDFAFVLHSLSWLTHDGTAVFICKPGILLDTGADQKIRMYLIDHNFVDCIIQLPSNLFNCVGTCISTYIVVLKKDRPDNEILFIDAGKYIKVNKKNRQDMPQSPEDLKRVVYAYKARRNRRYFTHLATYDEIVKNDYNLSVSKYVEVEEESTEKNGLDDLNVVPSIMDNAKLKSYEGNEPYIFISYAHKDDDKVLDIIKHLQDQGFRVFYDEEIETGSEWNENIAKHIEDCSCFCAMISSEYFKSKFCVREMEYALTECDKDDQNFVVYLEKVKIPGRIFLLRGTVQDIHYYEYEFKDDKEGFLEKLYSTELFQKCRQMPLEPAKTARPHESYTGEDPYIFVSYSHKNENLVLDIIKHLQDHGFRVFYDEGIDSGSDWNKYITDRIKDCDCFCAMFSEEYWASKICQNELVLAEIGYDKPNFGIYLQEAQIPPELKLIRGSKQDLFYYEFKDQEKFLKKLYSTEMFKNCLGESL